MDEISRAREAILDLVDRIYVINLPHRSDRRAEMQAQLARIGLSLDHPRVRLFSAQVFDDPGAFRAIGARGCFDSHFRLLSEMVDEGLSRVLVLEDDADFARHAPERLPELVKAAKDQDWGMIYGWHPDRHKDTDRVDDTDWTRLAPTDPVIMSHFYTVDQATATKLVAYLRAMMARKPGDPAGGPMDYDGALCWFRAAHPEVVTLVPTTPVAVQRPSRSDIDQGRWYDNIPALRPALVQLRRFKSALKR